MLYSLLFSLLCFADDAILVTAPSANADSIHSEDWDQSGGQVETALQTIPGLSFADSGGAGQTRSVFVRGARSEDTLVLIDGIPLNDPLSPSRSFDFAQIPVTEIDRIEVLKGPQGVLYGSDAMGGVVQIFTKKGEGPLHARVEAGAYDTIRARASYLGLHGGYEKSGGFSAADAREGNSERDAYKSWNLAGAKDLAVNENTNLRLQALYHEARVDTDKNGGAGGDSVGTYTNNSQLGFRAEALHLTSQAYEWSLAGSLLSSARFDNTVTPSDYHSNLWKIENRVRRNFGGHTPTLGVEYQEETGRATEINGRRSLRAAAGFIQEDLSRERWDGSLGARLDWHSDHHLAPTFRGAFGYWLLPSTLRWKSTLGTGFKSPSLYQTYSTVYGTPNLAPSRSIGGDTALEYNWGDWQAELGLFANRFHDLIDFDAIRNRYFNVGRAKTQGLEAALSKRWREISARNAFTLLRAIDQTTGLKLARRPAINDSLDLSYLPIGGMILRYVGRREDFHPALFTRQGMPAFFTVGLHAFYTYAEKWKLTARGENLLNRRYQETSGFGTAGRSFYLGVEADL